MRRYRWGYVRGTLACVATNIVAVQFPRVLGMAVDRIEKGTTRELILVFASLLVGIILVKGVFLYAQRWILIGISRDIEFDLRNDLFRKLELQDAGFFQRYRTGDIMARMTNDLNAVRNAAGPGAHVQRQHHLPQRFRAGFHVAHQPLSHAGGAGAHAAREHPHSVSRPQNPRPLRAHPGQLLRHLRAGPGKLLRRAPHPRLRARGVPDRPLRAAQPPVHRPRPAPGATDGHVMAHARVHPRRVVGHYPAGRRSPGSRASHFSWPVRRLQYLHDSAHLAHHRRGLGHQHLSARNGLGEAHRRAAQSRARHRQPLRRFSDFAGGGAEWGDRISPSHLRLRRRACAA